MLPMLSQTVLLVICLLTALKVCNGFTTYIPSSFYSRRHQSTNRLLSSPSPLPLSSSPLSLSTSYTESDADDTNINQKPGVVSDFLGAVRPLHWVYKVGILEETILFYKNNFNFTIYRHEEFTKGCEATCNGPYGGAWSKTMIGRSSSTESESFALELVYNYGISSYERGNDVRYMAMKYSSFVGSTSDIITDANNMKYLESPDGYLILLVDDVSYNMNDNPFVYVSLHVSDLNAAKMFYTNVLGANEISVQTDSRTDKDTVMMQWNSSSSSESVNVQLVQLPYGKKIFRGESHGRYAMETDEGVPSLMSDFVTSTGKSKNHILHGPVKLQPHGEEVIIVEDDDGHEYCYVNRDGFSKCISNNLKVSNSNQVDWVYRSNLIDKARLLVENSVKLEYGPDIHALDGLKYNHITSDEPYGSLDGSTAVVYKYILVELYASWCSLCKKRKGLLQHIAHRLRLSSDEAAVGVIDVSDRLGLVPGNDQLKAMLDWAKMHGYPFLYLIARDGDVLPYDGEWSESSIVSWISSNTNNLVIKQLDYFYKDDVVDDDGDDDDCDKCSL